MNNCNHDWEGVSDPNYWHCIKCDEIKPKTKEENKSYAFWELEKLLKEYNKDHFYYGLHGNSQYTPENFLIWLGEREEK